MHRIFNKNKMFEIRVEKNYIHNIMDKERELWNNKIKANDKCKTKNPAKQQIRKYKRHGSKLISGEKFVHTYEDIIMSITMICRVSTPKAIEFRSKLGFKQHDIILSKEQLVISKRTKLFSNEKMLQQHSVLGSRIDFIFLR